MSKYCDYPRCTVIFNTTWMNVMWRNVSLEAGRTSTVEFLGLFLLKL